VLAATVTRSEGVASIWFIDKHSFTLPTNASYTSVNNFSPRLALVSFAKVDSIASYVQNVRSGKYPQGVTTCTGLRDANVASIFGLKSQTNYVAGNICAQCLLDACSSAQLGPGLDLTGTLDSNNRGECDRNIYELSDFLAQSGRIVNLRIGNEVGTSHNNYSPERY
jgi:hypothetical protein